MTAQEQVAGRERLDLDGVNLARRQQRRRFPAVAITRAQDPLGQVHCKALRVIVIGRVQIDQLCVKSVSGASEAIHSRTVTGPVTSMSRSSGGVQKTSTLERSASGR